MSAVLSIRSHDVATTEETWAAFVPSARLQEVDPANFHFDWLSTTVNEVSLVRYRLGADVRAAVRPEGQIVTARITADAGSVRTGGTELERSRAWATDGREVQTHWKGSAVARTMLIDPRAAERLARRVTGDDELRLQLGGTSARSAQADQYWTSTFDHLLDSAVHAGEDPLITTAIERHAMMTMLSTFASSYQHAVERSAQMTSAPRTVRRAVAYIETHAADPLTVDDVAAAANISTRGLQYAFRRALDTTPTAYLRRVRLDAAHRDLLAPQPGDTVAAIARRWGFGHPSRFSADYRAAYGRHPGDVLRGG